MTHDRMQWWQEARFGMFIHWGVYSIPARGEWVMYQEHIPPSEYAPLASKFNPRRYDPDEWVELAKRAGMKYMVMTTRHHDGFSLFDSQVSEFTAPKTAAGRDLIQEYVEACHRGNMRVGFYFSLLDWRYPGYFRGPKVDPVGWKELVEYSHAQVRELCTNYGKVDILWYDGGWPYTAEDWRSAELNAMVRELQPEIVINNRSQLPEDHDTPEQHVRPSDPGRPWESCMTLNDSWGYNAADDNWKSPRQVIKLLVRCASGGGNLLLNVGPKPDGTIPGESVRILRDVGRWMDRNGGSIYGTTRSSFGSSTGMTTLKGRSLYAHVMRWPGRQITIPRIGNRVRSVHLMASGGEIRFEQKDDRLFLKRLPGRAPDYLDTVIVVELGGPPKALDYHVDGWDWAAASAEPVEAPIAIEEGPVSEPMDQEPFPEDVERDIPLVEPDESALPTMVLTHEGEGSEAVIDADEDAFGTTVVGDDLVHAAWGEAEELGSGSEDLASGADEVALDLEEPAVKDPGIDDLEASSDELVIEEVSPEPDDEDVDEWSPVENEGDDSGEEPVDAEDEGEGDAPEESEDAGPSWA